MAAAQDDTRWHQRFDNFDRAFQLLLEIKQRGVASLSQLEKEGAAKRFELAYELAWKTIKDYLEDGGLVTGLGTPREVIKMAFQAQVIDDGALWIELILQRNLLVHTYNPQVLDQVLQAFESRYFLAFAHLHAFFRQKLGATG